MNSLLQQKRQLYFILFTNTYALYIAAKGCLSCELVKHHEHGEQFMMIERWDCIESHQPSITHYRQEEMKQQ
ncbi:hypothetical protein H4J46_09575 [Colwellia sp. MB02u-6]|uniref:hypothetical protein n=1 Tax=Colwellia sp. MB02u-6 TaxID=2759824 RepID=UPI0015F53938|nr:hypothetical protein [Colwellia sp. MB02u-6]MBA6328184.1 hypothetical protein [Colwellia sp. MB02u-6]